MQAYVEFKKLFAEFINLPQSFADKDRCAQQLEEDVFGLFQSLDFKIQKINEELHAVQEKLHGTHEKLHRTHEKLHRTHEKLDMKNDELIKTMTQCHERERELNVFKDSARALVKVLNSSLKASSNIVARTIVETIAREQMNVIDGDVAILMNRFRRDQNYSRRSRTTIELIREAQRKTFWNTLNQEEQEDVQLIVKWHPQRQTTKHFLPIRDLLKRMWTRSKQSEIVIVLHHPKLGRFSESRDKIEKSFLNLYQTLSEAAHNHGLNYEEDILPIPDIDELKFSKADALALASFYAMALPKITYEIMTSVIDPPPDPFQLLNSTNTEFDLAGVFAENQPSTKRKMEENEENQTESAVVRLKSN